MAIRFDWYTNPPRHAEGEAEQEAQLHPRIHYNGSMSTQALCDEISRRSTLTAASVTACLMALSEVMGDRLAEGQKIHLDGIGYFYPTLTTTEPVVSSTKHKTSKVKFKGIEFQPDKGLKRSVGHVKVELMNAHVPGANPTDEQILRLLDGYFAERQVLRRIDFHYLTGMPQSTCRRCLRRLREEGVLTNIGSSTQPLYVRGEAK